MQRAYEILVHEPFIQCPFAERAISNYFKEYHKTVRYLSPLTTAFKINVNNIWPTTQFEMTKICSAQIMITFKRVVWWKSLLKLEDPTRASIGGIWKEGI